MNDRQLNAVVIGLASAIAAGFLALWFQLPPTVAVNKRLPEPAEPQAQANAGGSNGTAAESVVEPTTELKGRHLKGDGAAARSHGKWPRFRGNQFDNIVSETPKLAEAWPASGPSTVWSIKLDEGHGGPAVWDGAVFLMDYLEAESSDALRCFSLADGREIWRHSYLAPTKRNHGVSRTVPAVDATSVVGIGPRCHVVCVERQTGIFRWGIDMVRAHGAEVPLWYTGQCPLIDEDSVVLAPGGEALLLGADLRSGEIIWKTPNPDRWKMSHSSVMAMTLLGRRMYVYCSLQGVVGVAADGPRRGELLWKSAEWRHSVLAPSPVAMDSNRIFLTAGYGGGSMMLGLKESGNGIEATPVYRLAKTVFSCEQHTPIPYQGHLFGILPKDAGEFRGQLACLDPAGRVAWSSGMTERFGLGPFLVADGKMFVLHDIGELTLLRASITGFQKLARARVLQGRDAWAPMALVDGFLLLRDSERLVCLDVRDKGATEVAAARNPQ